MIDIDDNLTEEQIDKLMDEQVKQNNQLLKEFEQYLYSQNLAKKTVDKHIENIEFYINTYLLYTEVEKPEDNLNSIDMYFDYFLPNKTTFGSVADTKASIGSLKKFYKYLLELNRISKEDYKDMLQLIKENKEAWFAVYDDEFEDDDW